MLIAMKWASAAVMEMLSSPGPGVRVHTRKYTHEPWEGDPIQADILGLMQS